MWKQILVLPVFLMFLGAGPATTGLMGRESRDILLPVVGLEPGEEAPLLVFLHGMGSTSAEFESLFTSLAAEGKYTVFLPCGSAKVKSPKGKPAYSWDPDKDARKLIRKIRKIKDIDKTRIYLAGFSAGANMSYITVFEDASLFAGVISFSGGLQEGFIKESKVKKAPRGLSFHIVHGKRDRVMSVELGRNALTWLQARGFRATLQEFDGGHGIPANYLEIIDTAIGWFEEK